MPLKAIRLRPRKSTCGEQAQKRLIEAGLELFSRYSFDGVSTRFLADKANVNQASIQYYFGSKEGLYHAVTRHIVEQFMKRLQPVISKIEHQLDIDRPPREKCFHLLCELLDRAIITVLGSPDTKKWIGVAIREQIEPTDAFEILYEGVMKPFHSCLCSLVTAGRSGYTVKSLRYEGPDPHVSLCIHRSVPLFGLGGIRS